MKAKMMILILGGCCLSFIPVSAQEYTPGIKGGVNSARLTGFSGNNRVSGHIGFYLNQPLNNRWRFQPELLYSGEGQRYFDDGEERTLALDYIQLPFMFQYFPIRQLYFEFGPQVGILASAQDKGRGGNINVREDFTTAQIGINVGIGVKANDKIGFYGRYNFGITDVSRFDDIVDQSQVGQVGIAVRLK